MWGAVLIALVALAWGAIALLTPKRPAPTGAFVTVNGAQVHYLQMGSGPDLVLLHGASGNLRDWTFGPMAELAKNFRVTAFDRPGLGHSDAIPDVANVRAQARHLIDASEQLDLHNPIVLGHSYGGAIALGWALEDQENTSGLVLLAGASQVWPGGLGWQYDLATTPVLGWLAARMVPALAGDALTQRTLGAIFEPQDISSGYHEHIQPALSLQPEVVLNNARQVAGLKEQLRDMVALYPTLSLPVEIMHGTADDTVPLTIHSEKLATDLPDANLTRLDGIGHMPQHAAWSDVHTGIMRLAARLQR